MKISFPTTGQKTRKGTRPNTPGEKLVNVVDVYGAVERVRYSVAVERVQGGDWKFCPKKSN